MIDKKNLQKFFGEDEINYGDLMKIDTKKLPDFDMMIAGFSLAKLFQLSDKRKRNTRRTRADYIWTYQDIDKNIKYFILEKCKGLTNHNGNSLKVILIELDKGI